MGRSYENLMKTFHFNLQPPSFVFHFWWTPTVPSVVFGCSRQLCWAKKQQQINTVHYLLSTTWTMEPTILKSRYSFQQSRETKERAKERSDQLGRNMNYSYFVTSGCVSASYCKFKIKLLSLLICFFFSFLKFKVLHDKYDKKCFNIDKVKTQIFNYFCNNILQIETPGKYSTRTKYQYQVSAWSKDVQHNNVCEVKNLCLN